MRIPRTDATLTVGMLRQILNDTHIPDDAPVHCSVTAERYTWGVAYESAMYYGDGNFWIEATHDPYGCRKEKHENTQWVEDPFVAEIYNQSVMVWLCEKDYRELCDDI